MKIWKLMILWNSPYKRCKECVRHGSYRTSKKQVLVGDYNCKHNCLNKSFSIGKLYVCWLCYK